MALKTTQILNMTKKVLKETWRGDLKYFETLKDKNLVNHHTKGIKMLDVHKNRLGETRSSFENQH